ncbi:MAG: type III secretion system export apparatus subunit SctU [Deltaproteobacteria bacterium]|nr:type III secretion system export apparatus subunit SctU [Deltaproteobacteria bacterium]
MGDTGEKTEEATPEKLRKAKEEGQVPKSTDFVGALSFAVGFMTLAALFAYVADEMQQFVRASFDAASRDPSMATIGKQLKDAIPLMLKTTLPILGLVFVMGIMSNVLQTGFFFAFKAIVPKLDKINPVNGLKNLFKVKKLVELLKNIVKMVIIGWVAWSVLSDALHDIVLLATLPFQQSVDYASTLLWDFMVKVIGAFMVIGVLDLMYARHAFNKEMMMSKYDVKQEYKQQEGDPHQKGERRRLAHELLFSGGPAAVKNADAVVVNPEHIAVAIKYDQEKGKAPRIVAKGVRVHAEKIKELAKQYGVPILRNVPLAQALYKLELDEEIPEELYEAVAEVLAFVFKLKEEQENRHKPKGGTPSQPPGPGGTQRPSAPGMGAGARRLKGG